MWPYDWHLGYWAMSPLGERSRFANYGEQIEKYLFLYRFHSRKLTLGDIAIILNLQMKKQKHWKVSRKTSLWKFIFPLPIYPQVVPFLSAQNDSPFSNSSDTQPTPTIQGLDTTSQILYFILPSIYHLPCIPILVSSCFPRLIGNYLIRKNDST